MRQLQLATILFLTLEFLSSAAVATESHQFWVGADEAGIYSGTLDTESGGISNFRAVVANLDAYYIARHPLKPILYVASRTEGPSKLSSYLIDAAGNLTFQSELVDRPHGITHISISPDGRFLGAAYYRTGIAGVYRLDDSGAIESVFAEDLHQGKSVNAKQEAPHPHWAGFSQDSQIMFVPDLGTDEIWVYRVDDATSTLQLIQKAEAPPGSGPRHMVFHPTLNVAYVSDELKARVSRYSLDRETGELHYLDSMAPAAEATDETEHTVSDIRLHPSGRFLYLVNRGFDRVSVFAVDPSNGALTPVEREPVRGTISRNIGLEASGRWALVAGRDSNTLAVFAIDSATGALRYNGQILYVPTPMAIVIDQ